MALVHEAEGAEQQAAAQGELVGGEVVDPGVLEERLRAVLELELGVDQPLVVEAVPQVDHAAERIELVAAIGVEAVQELAVAADARSGLRGVDPRGCRAEARHGLEVPVGDGAEVLPLQLHGEDLDLSGECLALGLEGLDPGLQVAVLCRGVLGSCRRERQGEQEGGEHGSGSGSRSGTLEGVWTELEPGVERLERVREVGRELGDEALVLHAEEDQSGLGVLE